jgi:hypothetical protein
MSHLPSDRSFGLAKTCLEWHSWLDYENLLGLNSHLSQVYHTLATQTSFGLIAIDRSKAAQLLTSMNEAEFRSIVLKLYTEDGLYSKSAFLIDKPFGVDEAEKKLHSISSEYDFAPYTLPEKGKLRIFGAPDADCRKFPLENIRPSHLSRILSAMLDTKISSVETGVFDANPLMTRQAYTQAGLISDVPFHLLKTAWSRLNGTSLIRAREREW